MRKQTVKVTPSHRPNTTVSRVLRVGEANLLAKALVNFSIARSHHQTVLGGLPQILRFPEASPVGSGSAPNSIRHAAGSLG